MIGVRFVLSGSLNPQETTDMPSSRKDPHERLIPDKVVKTEFGVSLMTLMRWERNPALDFPPPIVINGHRYRSRKLLEKFKADLIRKAIADRHHRGRPPLKAKAEVVA
jgi:hypothetical protein